MEVVEKEEFTERWGLESLLPDNRGGVATMGGTIGRLKVSRAGRVGVEQSSGAGAGRCHYNFSGP